MLFNNYTFKKYEVLTKTMYLFSKAGTYFLGKSRKKEEKEMYLMTNIYEMTGNNECIKRIVLKVKNIDVAKKKIEKLKKKYSDYFYCFQLYDNDKKFIKNL